MTTLAAFSGGKDSTAMVLLMAEAGEQFECLFTPTGDELPEVAIHIDRVIARIGRPLVKLDAKPLSFWVEKQKALPNWRQRWCTRLIKIEPCVRYMKSLPERPTLCVGLRADEEERKGLYDDCAEYRYPLRERGLDKAAVVSICKQAGLMPPTRTDCALCFAQRLSEWRELWREHPDRFAKGEAWEAEIGHTLRSPGRDSWPAPLSELRKRFEAGYLPRGSTDQLDLIDDDQDENEGPCRVCRL